MVLALGECVGLANHVRHQLSIAFLGQTLDRLGELLELLTVLYQRLVVEPDGFQHLLPVGLVQKLVETVLGVGTHSTENEGA